MGELQETQQGREKLNESELSEIIEEIRFDALTSFQALAAEHLNPDEHLSHEQERALAKAWFARRMAEMGSEALRKEGLKY